jgi:glycosyltransferase involved in cell wall biosynthesis
MFDTFLLVTDDPSYGGNIERYIPSKKFIIKSFASLSYWDVPTTDNDCILVLGIMIDSFKYENLSWMVSKGSAPVFGMNLKIDTKSVKDLSIFEHIFQSSDEAYTQAAAIMSNSNVSYSPPFDPIPKKHIIGVISEYLIPLLPVYDFVEYRLVHESNRLHMFGCHGLIVRGMIDNMKDYVNVLSSCKPVLVLDKNDNQTLINTKVSSFLMNEVKWGGKEVEKHIRVVWWKNFFTNQKRLISHVRDVSLPVDSSSFIEPIMRQRPKVFINLDVLAKNFSNVHRSGWDYVLKGLLTLQRVGRQKGAGVIFDSCVENTFMWSQSADSNKYTSGWVGVIHHTFSHHCGPYNCCSLFSMPNFIESLDHCKALIVLSEYLGQKVRVALDDIGKSNVIVKAFKHPTEFVDKSSMWVSMSFDLIPLVHIGDFLRNKQAFFNLKTSWSKILVNTKRSNESGISCAGEIVEIQGFPSDIEVIGPLSDKDYDNLLSKSVVFLNLYDVSACNTLIECMVRATPVLVNRHPAVVEYIGEDYPGLYDTIEDAEELLRRPDYICEMHRYLVAKASTKLVRDLSLEKFITKIHDFLVTITTAPYLPQTSPQVPDQEPYPGLVQ